MNINRETGTLTTADTWVTKLVSGNFDVSVAGSFSGADILIQSRPKTGDDSAQWSLLETIAQDTTTTKTGFVAGIHEVRAGFAAATAPTGSAEITILVSGDRGA